MVKKLQHKMLEIHTLDFSFCVIQTQLCTSVSRVVVTTAVFHTRFRGSFPGNGGLKETQMFLPHPLVKLSIVGSLRDRKVACPASEL